VNRQDRLSKKVLDLNFLEESSYYWNRLGVFEPSLSEDTLSKIYGESVQSFVTKIKDETLLTQLEKTRKESNIGIKNEITKAVGEGRIQSILTFYGYSTGVRLPTGSSEENIAELYSQYEKPEIFSWAIDQWETKASELGDDKTLSVISEGLGYHELQHQFEKLQGKENNHSSSYLASIIYSEKPDLIFLTNLLLCSQAYYAESSHPFEEALMGLALEYNIPMGSPADRRSKEWLESLFTAINTATDNEDANQEILRKHAASAFRKLYGEAPLPIKSVVPDRIVIFYDES